MLSEYGESLMTHGSTKIRVRVYGNQHHMITAHIKRIPNFFNSNNSNF